jgi:hypothetical protein
VVPPATSCETSDRRYMLDLPMTHESISVLAGGVSLHFHREDWACRRLLVDGEVHLGVVRIEERPLQPPTDALPALAGKQRKWHLMNKAYSRAGSVWCEEGVDHVGKRVTGGEEDTRIEDPEDVVRRALERSNEVVDLGIGAELLVACEEGPFSL